MIHNIKFSIHNNSFFADAIQLPMMMCNLSSEEFHDMRKRREQLLDEKIRSKRTRRYVRDIIQCVSKNEPQITEVIMKGIHLPPETMTSLAMALIGNTNVQVLFLQHNDITPIGAQILASAVHANNHLEHLWLGENQICSAGVSAIATALYKNKTLKTLGLSNNGINREGALCLLDAMRKNRSVEGICLEGNDIDPKIEMLIQECAARNKRKKLQPSKTGTKEANHRHKCTRRRKEDKYVYNDESDLDDLLFHVKEHKLDPITEEAESDIESCDGRRFSYSQTGPPKTWIGNGRKVGVL